MSANPWLTKLKVVQIHPSRQPGNVRAFATIQIGDALEIHGVKVVQQPGQRAYVRLPDQQSEGRWFPVLKVLDSRFQDAVTELVMAAWQAKVAA